MVSNRRLDDPKIADYGAGIETALAAGDIERAAQIAQASLDAGQINPLVLNLLAWKYTEAGDYSQARGLLDRALQLAPDDPFIRIGLGSLLRREGQIREALATLDLAIKAMPQNPGAWIERAYAFEDIGLLDRAAADYREAIRLDSSLTPAMAGLASALSRQGATKEARVVAREALAREPLNIVATCALSRCDIEDGFADDVVAPLEKALAQTNIADLDRIIALGLLGDAHDRRGDCTAAFSSYEAANALFERTGHHPPAEISQRSFIEAITAALGRVPREAWRSLEKGHFSDDTGHAFLIGYPRSGTTLVETILGSLHGVTTAEEQPTLREADLAFLGSPIAIERLADLDPRECAFYRDAYWRRVDGLGGKKPGGLFVDMDPLKGIKLPIIAKLFPNARIVAMRRDPRDVVWSCFRQNFAPSAAAFEFTNLERTARHYDALMTLVERCFETLPLNVFVLRYEDLVRDFDAISQALCKFLDLGWTTELRDFHKSASRRVITTASTAQVRKSLYDGSGQWRRYEAHIAPVLPILRPWIEKFGYTG